MNTILIADALDVPLVGKRIYLVIQGAAPENAIPFIINVIGHICRRFQMNIRKGDKICKNVH
jgi:hypothetical protein